MGIKKNKLYINRKGAENKTKFIFELSELNTINPPYQEEYVYIFLLPDA